MTQASLTPDPEPDSLGLDIAILDSAWERSSLDLDALCNRAIRAAQSQLETVPAGELSIAFVDNDHIKRLNAQYRGKNAPTNVLSFPAGGHNPALGDIVIARQICEAEAAQTSVAFADHITHLCVHGYLHLCGYDHENDEDAAKMERLEILALASLTIKNPYEDAHV